MSFYAWKPVGSAAASVPSIVSIKTSAASSPFLYGQYVLQQNKPKRQPGLSAQDVKTFHTDVRLDSLIGGYSAGLSTQCAPLVAAVRDISQDPRVLDAVVNTHSFNSLLNLAEDSNATREDLPVATRNKMLQHQLSSSTFTDDGLAMLPPAVAEQVKIFCSSCYNLVSPGEVQEAMRGTPAASPPSETFLVAEACEEGSETNCVGHAGDPGLIQPSHRQELLEGVVAPLAVAAVVCAVMWKVTPNLAAVVFSHAIAFVGRIFKSLSFKLAAAK